MKRSEANGILENRIEFSTEYDCFSVCEIDGNSEATFNHYGCDCCISQPCDTFDVTCLTREDLKLKQYDNVHTVKICGGCLCSMVNGDDSDLDYNVDDEDCEPITKAV